ncbi:MAG: alpha/beta hydrolase [Sphingomonadaceae bacterium]
MTDYSDRYWQTGDGLTLHYRDYPGGEGTGRPPIVCLPGLTRNVRDFEELAARLAGNWRVICIENRGRGDSEYAKDAATYTPQHYVEDLIALLDEQGIERFVAFGTSLGGLMTFILAMIAPGRIAGAMINDIGAEIDPVGYARIKDYVGQGRSFPTWVHAARALAETQGMAYPDFELADWLALAKRLMVVSSNNRIVFDYDMKIAEAFAELDDAAPDAWPAVKALAGKPLLFVRGGISDILSAATLDEMLRLLPDAEGVTIPNVGHAPLLTEPEAAAAIDRLLARIA